MTKSTITREESIQAVFDLKAGYTLGFADIEILKRVARMALAAMAGEPFAYIIQDKYERERGVEGHLSRSHVSKYVSQEDINEHEITCTPLYRHAQQPVVPCPFPCGWDNLNKLAIQNSALVARYLSEGEQVTEEIRQAAISNNDSLLKVIAACRAAMLQAGYAVRDLSTPVDPQVAEYEQNVMQAGNSPVIPEGYVMVPKEPTAEMIAAAMNCDDVLFNSDESFCVQFGNIYEAMLAAAPQEVKP